MPQDEIARLTNISNYLHNVVHIMLGEFERLAIAMTAPMLVWGGIYMRNWFLFLPAWWLVAHAERSELSNEKVAA